MSDNMLREKIAREIAPVGMNIDPYEVADRILALPEIAEALRWYDLTDSDKLRQLDKALRAPDILGHSVKAR